MFCRESPTPVQRNDAVAPTVAADPPPPRDYQKYNVIQQGYIA